MSGIIGLDTNILVRFIVHDDAAQTALARKLIYSLNESKRGFISITVLIELLWVLDRTYKIGRVRIAGTIQRLLETAAFEVEGANLVSSAYGQFKSNSKTDFADALIIEAARQAGAQETVTFDKRAAATLGMTLLK